MNKIVMSEEVNGKTFIIKEENHWPFKFWVGEVDSNDRAVDDKGKRARDEGQALELLATMVDG